MILSCWWSEVKSAQQTTASLKSFLSQEIPLSDARFVFVIPFRFSLLIQSMQPPALLRKCTLALELRFYHNKTEIRFKCAPASLFPAKELRARIHTTIWMHCLPVHSTICPCLRLVLMSESHQPQLIWWMSTTNWLIMRLKAQDLKQKTAYFECDRNHHGFRPKWNHSNCWSSSLI